MAHHSSASTTDAGFSLIEVMLALALFAVGVGTIGAAILYTGRAQAVAGRSLAARAAVEECVAAVRFLRDRSGIGALPEGTYSFASDMDGWRLVPPTDSGDVRSTAVITAQSADARTVACSAAWDVPAPDSFVVSLELSR